MKTKLPKAIVTFLPVLCFAATASAKDAEIPRAQKPDPRAASKAALIERYDKDKNGQLDNEEIETIGRERILQNDRNKDGRVDQVELKNPKTVTRKNATDGCLATGDGTGAGTFGGESATGKRAIECCR